MKLYLLFSLTFLFQACHSRKTVPILPTPLPTPEAVDVIIEPAVFVVSFISIGGGTDYKAMQQFESFLLEFEENNDFELVYTKMPWGREGEVDFCFNTTDLTTSQKALFMRKTKERLAQSKLVRYPLSGPCYK